MNKKTFLFLIFPVACLLILVAGKFYQQKRAKTFRFPIEAYDPRDLLSGHYLRFQVKYPSSENCGDTSFLPQTLCLEPELKLVDGDTKDCTYFIKGNCSHRRFRSTSEIDRFYIPQEHALKLEKLIQNPLHRPSVELYVMPDGTVQIKELLIDEKPWLSWIDP